MGEKGKLDPAAERPLIHAEGRMDFEPSPHYISSCFRPESSMDIKSRGCKSDEEQDIDIYPILPPHSFIITAHSLALHWTWRNLAETISREKN